MNDTTRMTSKRWPTRWRTVIQLFLLVAGYWLLAGAAAHDMSAL